MRATGNFENARNVDPMVALSDATRAHIDHWLGKSPGNDARAVQFTRRLTDPQGRERSISTQGTREVIHSASSSE